MLQNYGVDRFYNLLNQLGMTTLFRPAHDYGLSLILGGAEATLWDLARIYSRMAYQLQSGYNLPLRTDFDIHYLIDQESALPVPSIPYPITHAALWQVFDAMVKVSRPGQDNAWRSFSSSHHIAWKTGTSYGHRDAWAVGVTPDYVAAVWVGNADGAGRPGLSGLKNAAPILFDIFNMLPLKNWFIVPEMDLQMVTICAKSGYRRGIHCTSSEQILTGNADQTRACPYCVRVHLDAEMQSRVSADCAPINEIYSTGWFVLPPLIEWYYAQNHADYRILPQYSPDCQTRETRPLALIYPQENSKIFVPVELNGRLGRALFEATHREPDMNLFWHIDNQYVGNTRDIHQIALAPVPGMHILTVVDESGNFVQRRFEIISRN
jgi:penicillin-binding protein 1C